jgi:uncharacterized BrkB/YihY/UPF0761 family membrane protein
MNRHRHERRRPPWHRLLRAFGCALAVLAGLAFLAGLAVLIYAALNGGELPGLPRR